MLLPVPGLNTSDTPSRPIRRSSPAPVRMVSKSPSLSSPIYALRVVVPSSTVIIPKPAWNSTSLEEPDRSITSSEPVRVPVALVMTVPPSTVSGFPRFAVSCDSSSTPSASIRVVVYISNPADAVENSFPATSTWEATTDRPAPWPITIMSSLLSV